MRKNQQTTKYRYRVHLWRGRKHLRYRSDGSGQGRGWRSLQEEVTGSLRTLCSSRVDKGQEGQKATGIRSGIAKDSAWATDIRGAHECLQVCQRRRKTPFSAPFRRVETKPGAQGQADWLQKKIYIHELGGETDFGIHNDVVPPRMWSGRLESGRNMLSWLTRHNRASEFLGGIPFTVRIDNLKTGVASGGRCRSRRSTKAMPPHARQMDFAPDPTGQDAQRQGQGRTKGSGCKDTPGYRERPVRGYGGSAGNQQTSHPLQDHGS